MELAACPIRGCTAGCEAGRILCPRHWQLVPAALRKRVTTTYRRFQRAHSKHQSLAALQVREARALWMYDRSEAVAAVVSQVGQEGRREVGEEYPR